VVSAAARAVDRDELTVLNGVGDGFRTRDLWCHRPAFYP
jgi:hypothetical protein